MPMDIDLAPPLRLLQLLAVLAPAALGTGVCAAQEGNDAALQGPVREVTQAERAFARTMAERDPKAFSGFVAEDAVFRQGERLLVGRSSVMEGWRDWLKPGPAPFSWEPDRVTADRAGDTAISSGPVRGPTGTVIGRFTTIWRKQAGPDGNARWQVIVDQGVPLIGCATTAP